MPIFIRDEDIEWCETKKILKIEIHMPNVNENNASILHSHKYIKVSSFPYIWECFLNGIIDVDNSIVRINTDLIVFELLKTEDVLWNAIKDPNSCEEEYCKQQRELAMKEIQEKAATVSEKKALEKHENQRIAVRRQILIDDIERKRIEVMKETERRHLEEDLKQIKTQSLMKKGKTTSKKISSLSPMMNISQNINSKPNKVIPSPRKTGQIAVNFTPRAFPSAARESRHEEEIEWLEKQTAAREYNTLDCSELNEKERNPIWLKEKGDTFYARGDFHSAINAYNLAVRLCPTMYSLFSNRSACHLQLHNLHKAVEDSSKALDLMGPVCSSNTTAYYKCHVRRGTAFCQLELFVEGLGDFEAALKVFPHDDSLRIHAQKIRSIIQSGH